MHTWRSYVDRMAALSHCTAVEQPQLQLSLSHPAGHAAILCAHATEKQACSHKGPFKVRHRCHPHTHVATSHQQDA